MERYSSCEKNTLVHQLLDVNAKVTVAPLVSPGDPKVSCIKTSLHTPCDYEEDCCTASEGCPGKCTFYVTQTLCVEIPITFGVEVDVDEGKVRCCGPEIGPCKCRNSVCNDEESNHPCKEKEFLSPCNCGGLSLDETYVDVSTMF